MCHSDPDMTGERDGKEISVFVDEDVFAGSMHAELECVMCHQDLMDSDFPHDSPLERVDCSFCHDTEAEQQARSLHGEASRRGDALAPTCATCHGTHDIHAHTDPSSPTAVMNIPFLCGRCHSEGTEVSEVRNIPQEHILENYSMSIHGEGLYRQGLTVTAVCTSCHTPHEILPHTDERSSIHHDNVAKTCAKCHGQIEAVHRKVIEGRLWEEEPHKIPACVDCHSPHEIRRAFYPAGVANKDCLTCHGQVDLVMQRGDETISLYVDEDKYNLSTHVGTACAQCHTEINPALERPCESVQSNVDCSICHAEQVTRYLSSSHGIFEAQGDTDAPDCQDCHAKHAVQDNDWPNSPTYPRNVPNLCGRCHREGEQAAVRIHGPTPDIVGSYMDSIHGKGLVESGLVVTATCADCHTAHGELPPGNPASTVNKSNIATTCGTCHHGIEETFRTSIHWPGNSDTDKQLPTCDDCHTSHTISRTDQGGFRTVMMNQCGRCHAHEAETFFDTFHGKVSRLGLDGAAKCYDCHGTHGILPPDDPESTLSRENVVDTCGKCHAGSHRQFAGYLTHATHHDSKKYPWLFWAFWFMTTLLVGTLTFFLLHTIAWLIRLWLTRDQWKHVKARSKAGKDAKLYRRFNKFQRSLHFTMLISFFTLALTGMTLKFSYMGWAQWLSWLLGGFEATGFLHRVGGIALFIIFGLHLRDVWQKRKKSGETWMQVMTGPNSIVPNLNDVKELYGSVRWFFGLGERPRYGRYTYWEKFDYFAVFWGVLIIGSTGIALWFPEFFTRFVPGWGINVATIVHSDEALLAVGFIFTIHFFNTHFRPDKFPMDPVIFTGRLTVEELKHDKPREYEYLVENDLLEENLVPPFHKSAERGAKIFGFTALAIGLSLIALIVYAMVFGYR